MASEPKSLAMLALGKMHPEGEPDGDEADEGLEMAMQDLVDAIDSKDTKAMAAAFRAAMDMC